MRAWFLAGALALAAFLGEAEAAEPVTLSAEGKCNFNINNGEVSAGEACKRLSLTQDPNTGEAILRLEFETGLTFEIVGPAIQLNEAWRFMSPSTVAWTNPGDAARQNLSNYADSERDQIAGRCAVAFQRSDGGIYEVYCNLKSPLGIVVLEFKTPRR